LSFNPCFDGFCSKTIVKQKEAQNGKRFQSLF